MKIILTSGKQAFNLWLSINNIDFVGKTRIMGDLWRIFGGVNSIHYQNHFKSSKPIR